ncbi:MAG: molybdenum cofactor biosynthesis protein MoaE [Acidobacteriaceae bacterium]|nr:molybdenum cofactor biosynthesis protein MoaE [Acidobacteriaceae bacterium]
MPLIRVRVLSFGPLKTVFGNSGSVRELSEGATVRDLVVKLRGESLLAEQALCSAAVAVNQEYVKADHVLQDGDEVAVLPPVSGGTEPAAEMPIALVLEPIVVVDVVDRIRQGVDGAMVTFDGVVRNNTRGRQTMHLDYEAYQEMALSQMNKLREEAIATFGVREVAIVHRLGRLLVGETSVLIVVASAHRGAAFDACRWVIDTLKKTVPIWKKEQFVDGALWVDGEPFPDELRGATR